MNLIFLDPIGQFTNQKVAETLIFSTVFLACWIAFVFYLFANLFSKKQKLYNQFKSLSIVLFIINIKFVDRNVNIYDGHGNYRHYFETGEIYPLFGFMFIPIVCLYFLSLFKRKQTLI